jgi:hypothetical protein
VHVRAEAVCPELANVLLSRLPALQRLEVDLHNQDEDVLQAAISLSPSFVAALLASKPDGSPMRPQLHALMGSFRLQPLPTQLLAILSGAAQLTHMQLPGHLLSDEGGVGFLRSLTHLEALLLDESYELPLVSAASLAAAIAPLHGLTRLSFKLEQEGPLADLGSLQLPPQLRELELRNAVQTDFVQCMTGLSKLSVSELVLSGDGPLRPRAWSLPPPLKVNPSSRVVSDGLCGPCEAVASELGWGHLSVGLRALHEQRPPCALLLVAGPRRYTMAARRRPGRAAGRAQLPAADGQSPAAVELDGRWGADRSGREGPRADASGADAQRRAAFEGADLFYLFPGRTRSRGTMQPASCGRRSGRGPRQAQPLRLAGGAGGAVRGEEHRGPHVQRHKLQLARPGQLPAALLWRQGRARLVARRLRAALRGCFHCSLSNRPLVSSPARPALHIRRI